MPKDAAPTDADVIFNRANVALARSQSLIQSWLPPKTSQEVAHQKSEQELLKEDEELFKPVPELLGLGAEPPSAEQDSLFKRRSAASNDRLLEQLLGKKAAKGHRAASKPQPAQTAAVVTKPAPDQQDALDDDDDDAGRANMVASNSAMKRKPRKAPQTSGSKDTVHRAKSPSDDENDDPRPTKKRTGTYLDQLLAEKANKKKKKQKT